MDPTQNNLVCGNCGLVTLADGRQVWVCEHCGTENVPAPAAQPTAAPGIEVPAAPVPVAPEPAPINPDQVTPVNPTTTP